jgi:hypothetical protein
MNALAVEKWNVNSDYSILLLMPSNSLILASWLLELLLQSFKPYSTDASLWGKSFISLDFRRNPLIRSGSKFHSLLEISSIEAFIPLMSTSPSLLEITSIESFKPFISLLKSLVGDGDVMLRLPVALRISWNSLSSSSTSRIMKN